MKRYDIVPIAEWLIGGARSASEPQGLLAELCNQYFDCQVLPILERGGEVLKFIGDGTGTSGAAIAWIAHASGLP